MDRGSNILLVDDNDDDAFFLEKAFQTIGSTAHILRCIDGREAQLYLLGEPPFADRGFFPLPDLVVLDLKIPHINGLAVLKWIREHPDLCNLIVVVFTSSSQQHEIDAAYALHANCFLTKPASLTETTELARSIQRCWLTTLPSRPELDGLRLSSKA
jgi:CheY-like chemotaxis protein